MLYFVSENLDKIFLSFLPAECKIGNSHYFLFTFWLELSVRLHYYKQTTAIEFIICEVYGYKYLPTFTP